MTKQQITSYTCDQCGICTINPEEYGKWTQATLVVHCSIGADTSIAQSEHEGTIHLCIPCTGDPIPVTIRKDVISSEHYNMPTFHVSVTNGKELDWNS